MLHFNALVHNANQLEKEYKALLLSLTLANVENFALKNEVGRLNNENNYLKCRIESANELSKRASNILTNALS